MQPCLGRKAIILGLVSLFATVSTATAQDVDRSREILQAVVVKDNAAVRPTSDETVVEEPTLANTSLSRIGVQTAQPISISIADAIAKALENNNTVEITRDDVRFQETQIRVIRGAYDPVFTIAPTYTRNSNTGSTATNDFNVNSSMTHFIQPGGGNYTVFFNNNRTENAFAQAQLSSGSIGSSATATSFSSLGFRYTQPLLRNRSIDSTRRSLKIARIQLEQSDFDFRRQTIDTVTLVQRAYWDLVFALRDRQNRQANLELTRENLRQIQARIDAGAAAPIARAEVETELASREGDVLLATQQVSIAENNLKQLILRDVTNPEWSQSYIPTDAPEVGSTAPSLNEAMESALNNRYELRRLKLARDINEVDIRFFKNQTRPQIDFNTTVSLDGIARGGTNEEFVSSLYTSPGDIRLFNSINQIRALPTVNLPPIVNDQIIIPAQPSYLFGGFGRSLGNLFRSDAPNYSFGLTISFPLRNETAKANLAGARILQNRLATQTRAEEQAVIVEVRNAVQAVETARLRVATSRRARENAEIQLEGERRLFEAGRSTTFLLFQRENTLTNARNAEIRAETDYEKALADLHRVTSVTLEENSIQLESPLDDR
jgi:outer membrane protein TolC